MIRRYSHLRKNEVSIMAIMLDIVSSSVIMINMLDIASSARFQYFYVGSLPWLVHWMLHHWAESCRGGDCLWNPWKDHMPFISTFACFLSRAFDQIRMGAISQTNANFVGSHSGVSIGKWWTSLLSIKVTALIPWNYVYIYMFLK